MFMTRVRLYASTLSAISVATFGSVFIRKCVAPIRAFIVPKGCSTVSRRTRIACGFWSRRRCAASSTCSCSHRVIRRSLPVVHWSLMAQERKCTPRRPARTRGEKRPPRGSAHSGRARTPSDPGQHPRYQACRTSDRRGSPVLHGRSTAPSGSQRHIPRPASGSSVPDRSTDDPWTNNEVQVRCEARTDRERCRSSAPCDLRGPRRQDETRRTADLGHSSDGPSWIDLAAIRINTTESRFVACLNRLLQHGVIPDRARQRRGNQLSRNV
jgi:hypothetical protein